MFSRAKDKKILKRFGSRLRQMAKVNLYHVNKFSPKLSFAVHYFYRKICSFTLVYPLALSWTVFICLFSIL